MRLLDLSAEDGVDLQGVFAGAASCLDGLSTGRTSGKRTGAMRQTHNSLIGRFFHKKHGAYATERSRPTPATWSRVRNEGWNGHDSVLFQASGSKFVMTKALPWPAKPGKARKNGKTLPSLKTARVHCARMQVSSFDCRVSFVTPIHIISIYVEEIAELGGIIRIIRID